jgi:hypothetical protein
LVLDHCIQHLDLWFWFAAFVSYIYREVLDANDRGHHLDYFAIAEEAERVRGSLEENYRHVVAEERSSRG